MPLARKESIYVLLLVLILNSCTSEYDKPQTRRVDTNCVVSVEYKNESSLIQRGDLTLGIDPHSTIRSIVVHYVGDHSIIDEYGSDTLWNVATDDEEQRDDIENGARLVIPEGGWYALILEIDESYGLNIYRSDCSYRQVFVTSRRPTWYDESVSMCAVYVMVSTSDLYHDAEYWYQKTDVTVLP